MGASIVSSNSAWRQLGMWPSRFRLEDIPLKSCSRNVSNWEEMEESSNRPVRLLQASVPTDFSFLTNKPRGLVMH